ncbi:MAG: hypothetical protein KTR33_01235 [Gammaproteobacteria bacterium]|nr:hypothetical protein [Gammaproteobacteria bacterium]
MNQTDDGAQQLQIWKDLAISKQMIMNEAATALKLKSEWSQEELKEALDTAIKKGNEAEVLVKRNQSETDRAIADMQEELRKANKARDEAIASVETAEQARAQAEQQLANGRRDNAEALKKAKQQVLDKDKELKAINSALADTPENVLKKLKNLKKQKHDESQARTRAEEAHRKLKKENKKLEEDLEVQSKLVDQGSLLLAAYQELREISESQQSALKEAGQSVEDIPELAKDLLDAFATEEPEEEEKELATA